MSALVDTAVTNALKTDATLSTLAPGGIYRDVAPEAVVSAAKSDPSQVFGILTLQSEVPLDSFDNKPLDEARLLVKFVSPSTSSVGAQAARDRAMAVLEGLSGTVVSGFAITCSKRAERMAYVENDGPVFWQHRGVSWLVVSSPTS
mgnify:FL=1